MKTLKLTLTLALILIGLNSNAQLISGDLLDEGRKIITQTDYTMMGSKAGVIYFQLAVDREGNVTSDQVIEGTTINSTPLLYGAKSYVRRFKFEKGTHYPKFHHVVVKITIVPYG